MKNSGRFSKMVITPMGSTGTKKLMTCEIPVKPPQVKALGTKNQSNASA